MHEHAYPHTHTNTHTHSQTDHVIMNTMKTISGGVGMSVSLYSVCVCVCVLLCGGMCVNIIVGVCLPVMLHPRSPSYINAFLLTGTNGLGVEGLQTGYPDRACVR